MSSFDAFFLLFLRLEIVPYISGESRSIPHVCLPFFCHFVESTHLWTRDEHIELVDPLIPAIKQLLQFFLVRCLDTISLAFSRCSSGSLVHLPM